MDSWSTAGPYRVFIGRALDGNAYAELPLDHDGMPDDPVEEHRSRRFAPITSRTIR